MDVKTTAENLLNLSNQLMNTISNINMICNSILSEASQDSYNIDIIKSYVAGADIQITAMNAQETLVQVLLDSLSALTVTTKKSSKATS